MTSKLRHLVSSSVAAAAIAIVSAPATAQSPQIAGTAASEINAANKLLRDGKVDEALEAFHRVRPGDQQRDELNYNTAVAEYRKGNIDAAEMMFGEVAGTSAPAISSNSRYNLGNCQYAKAVQVAEQDRPAAIEHLRNAVSHYRGALRGNSSNADARANIELACALIRKLEQKHQDEQKEQEQEQPEKEDKKNNDQQDQKEQPEQKDDSQKDGEQQESDSGDSKSEQQKSEEQKEQSEASASDKSKKDEQKQDAQKSEEPGDESQKTDDQKSPSDESQSGQQKPSDQEAQPKGSDGKQTQPQNLQQQSGDQKPSGDQQQTDDEGKPKEQDAKNQPVPAGDLKAAGPQDEKKKPVGTGAMADPNAKDGLMTREEALKMLQSVRDRDMLRRMQQQRQERSRHVPVDRDW